MDLFSETPRNLLRMCCACERIFLSLNGHSKWIDKTHPMYEDLILSYGGEQGDITHTYCDVCLEKDYPETYHKIKSMKDAMRVELSTSLL